MFIVLKLLLFAISTLGQWEILHRRFARIDISFVPAVTVAAQCTILYLAGILNILPEVVWCLNATGFISLLIIMIRERGISFIRHYLKPSYLFLFVSLITASIFLKGRVFTHYDNFSHWALVARRIFETNRFPNYADKIIEYQQYPVGSAAFIYYFTKLTNNSESLQMLAQFYMMMVSIIPLFSLCKKSWPSGMLLICAYTNFFLVYNIPITDLLVDTLLPLVSMCSLLYAVKYCRKNGNGFDYAALSFLLIQIVQIKNSGLFFAAFICILLLPELKSREGRGLKAVCLILPFISFLIWDKHCQYVFDSANLSKHAMTAEYYYSVAQVKTAEDFLQILKSIIIFILSWRDLWVTAGVLLAEYLLLTVICREGKKYCLNVMLLSLVLFLLYQAGMYGMYIFSMPEQETARLAGIDRYEKTIIIAVMYLSLIPMLRIVSDHHSAKKAAVIFATAIMTVCPFAHLAISEGQIPIPIAVLHHTGTSPEKREWIETTKNEYQIPDGSSYMMLIPESDRGYSHNLCKYIFQSNSVQTMTVSASEDLDAVSARYILIYDADNQIIQDWVQLHYPEQAGLPAVKTD